LDANALLDVDYGARLGWDISCIVNWWGNLGSILESPLAEPSHISWLLNGMLDQMDCELALSRAWSDSSSTMMY